VAVLARLADEGARVILILLALRRTGSAALGGELVAALLVPHVVAAPLISAFAVGGLLGSLAYARRPFGQHRPERLAVGGLLASGLPLALATLLPGLVWPAVLFALAGVATGPQVSGLFTTRERHAPPGVRTQVFTLGAAVKTTAAAIGAVLAGRYAAVGPYGLLLAVAACYVAGTGAGGLLLTRTD
jgi:hypothetical protein